MKQIKFIAILFLATCLFASCHNNDGPSKDMVKKMKETAQNWMPYLSDNYQVGDSVYFLRTDLATQETQVEGFLVAVSEFGETGYEQEDDPSNYEDEENTNFSNVVDGYMDVAILKSKNIELNISLYSTYNSDTKNLMEICSLAVLGENYVPCLEVSHMTIDEDYMTVTSCSDKCTMQRNVGIIRFSNDQYSWKLIEKN